MSINRRKFIRQSALATSGIGMAGVMPSHLFASKVSASDKINVALIGCRNMGFGILQHALNNADVNCVAICDIDDRIISDKAAELKKSFNSSPQTYKDFRKMLEQKDIDAVIIGTPDHWHCLNTVYSLQAGKDVYVEKPMANSILECNIMVNAAKKYKKIVQVGQQQRSSFIFKTAMEMIKSGKIGTLRKINVWANYAYGVGPVPVPDEAVPQGVDYEMWLGPAPRRPFNRNRFHGSWRHFWDYGGGLMSDWGVHLIDMALWAKDKFDGPQQVIAYAANTFTEKRARETFDSMNIIFPNNTFVINWDMTAGLQSGPYGKAYGLAFLGDNGTIVVNRETLDLFPERDNQTKALKSEEYTFKEGKESHGEHVRNFLDCIKSRKAPACTPEMGRAAAIHVHAANIAARTGLPFLKWDDTTNRFSNSIKANELIKPEYHGQWSLPKI
jgi:predicted dehydrogenase